MSNGSKSTQKPGISDTKDPSSKAVRDGVERIQKSTEFDGATRLKSFLSYVVEEELAGRGSAIRAKTIAEDIYGILSHQGSDPLAVVRVDALRLRRRLDAFYRGSGLSDPLRIYIDSGGYIPRYELVPAEGSVETTEQSKGNVLSSRTFLWVGVLGVAAAVVISFAVAKFDVFLPQKSQPSQSAASETAVREALFSASPAKLQARNLADDARRLMFPALDRQRLMAALTLFERVIDLDSAYYAGFAGSAQVKALLAVQMPAGPAREQHVLSSTDLAQRAVELAPDAAWSHSAAAMAAYSDAECRDAAAHSKRALSLDPDDLFTLNFDAIISLFCGDFERALEVADANVGNGAVSEQLVFRNVAASAEFHLGYFQESADRYSAAVQSGAPVGALTLSYLAAAYHELGQTKDARGAVDLLVQAWPEAPIDKILPSVFVDPRHAQDVLTPMRAAGWSPMNER
ncbi:hypothetical protein [Shimia sp.]|uniref:hypothetical protein n=1 Tax=Shimia sp. TaxID=1954381 RepID=UPI0032983F5A